MFESGIGDWKIKQSIIRLANIELFKSNKK